MAKEIESKNITGLENVENRQEAEKDLLTSLLEAAEYKTAEDNITEAEIKRRGKLLFRVHLHPISEPDARVARKKATTYMPNPNNKKMPPIEKEYNHAKFNSWLIYLATTEEDQQKIWGNPALMKQLGLNQPVDAIDALLTIGEKQKLADLVTDISGMNDEEDEDTVSNEEYAKN